MVQEVMCHVVACVAKDASTISCQSCIPIPKYNGVCKFPERCSKCDEEGRRHDQSVFVHRKVMMDAV